MHQPVFRLTQIAAMSHDVFAALVLFADDLDRIASPMHPIDPALCALNVHREMAIFLDTTSPNPQNPRFLNEAGHRAFGDVMAALDCEASSCAEALIDVDDLAEALHGLAAAIDDITGLSDREPRHAA